MNAARKNNVETVTLLLQRGADVTLKDATDKTSLYMSAEEDCWDVLDVRFTFLIILYHFYHCLDSFFSPRLVMHYQGFFPFTLILL